MYPMPYYSDTHLTAPQRDKMIVELRRRGYSHRAIGKVVGMDASGVRRALQRIQAWPLPVFGEFGQ